MARRTEQREAGTIQRGVKVDKKDEAGTLPDGDFGYRPVAKVGRKNPAINVAVYVTQDEEVAVDVCDCTLNPIAVRIGEQYSTNAVKLFLSVEKAQRLHTALALALQAHMEEGIPDDGPPLQIATGG